MVSESLRRLGLWAGAVVVAFAAGAAAAALAMRSAPLWIGTDLLQPLPVVTAWHDFGFALAALLFATVAAAAAGYLMAVRAAARLAPEAHARGLAVLTLASIAAALAAMLFPAIFSSDVYAYAAYGDLALHHLNPYARVPIVLRDDIIRAAIWQWGNPPPISVYGPAFVWIARAVTAALSASGVAATLLAFRLCAVLALAACGLLMYHALAGAPPGRRLAAAAGIALNPVAIWAAAEGHNDALMLAVVLAGVMVWRRGGPFAGTLIVTCAALIKAPGAAAAGVLALYAYGARRRPALLATAAGLAAGALLVVLIALPFEQGVLKVFVPHAHYAPEFSAQWLFYRLLASVLPPALHSFELGVSLALVGCGILMLYGARRLLAGDFRGAAWLALGVWFLIPNAYPWYALWILPVAFAVGDAPVGAALIAASLTVIFRYLPDAAYAENAALNVLVTLCELSVPAAVALWPRSLRLQPGAQSIQIARR